MNRSKPNSLNKSAAKLWQLLQRETESVDEVPKGFKTVRQWAAEFGKSNKQTRDRLTGCKDMVEIQSFRIRIGQVCRPVPHYRIKS